MRSTRRRALPLLALLVGLAGCQAGASVGQARSLWRLGERESLVVARRAADAATPEEAPQARRLVAEISLELGSCAEARAEYEKLARLTRRHDDGLLRRLCQRLLREALASWDAARRMKAVAVCRELDGDSFRQLLHERARRDVCPEVRAAVAVSLAASPGRAWAAPLAALRADMSPEVRAAALYALGRLGAEERPAELRATLEGCIAKDPSPELRIVALRQLARLGPLPETLLAAAQAQGFDELSIEYARLHRLGATRPDSQVGAWKRLEAALGERFTAAFLLAPPRARLDRAQTLGLMASDGQPRARDLIMTLLASPDPGLVIAGLAAAREVHEPEFIERVLALTAHPDPELRAAALLAAALLDPVAAAAHARPLLTAASATLRIAALEALDHARGLPFDELTELALGTDIALATVAIERIAARGSAALPALLRILSRASAPIRLRAIHGLATLGPPSAARSGLAIALKDPVPEVARAALAALRPLRIPTLKDSYVTALNEPRDDLDLDAAAALLILDRSGAGPLATTGS